MRDSLSARRATTSGVITTVATVCPPFLVGGLSVQISADLHFSPAGLGLAIAVYFVVSALASFYSGQLVERLGTKLIASIAVLLAAGCLLGIAVISWNFTSLAVLLAMAGPANSLGQLSSNALLSRNVPSRRQGLVFGLKQAAIPLSTTLAGLAVPILALTVGWRWGFVAAAALALLALPLIPSEDQPKVVVTRAKKRLDPALVVITIAGAFGATAANPVGSFIADYGVDSGLSEVMSGLNLTIGGLTGVIARVGVGWLADRRSGGRLTMIAVMLAAGAAALALLTAPTAWTIPLGTIGGFALGWAWPGLLNFAITRRYPDAPAAATGVTQIGVYLGGALGPLSFGWIVEAWSYTVGWWTMSALMLTGAILMAIGRRMLLSTKH